MVPMDIAARLSIALGRDAALAGAAPEAGDRLPVRVLEVRADGKVLVDCGRFRAVAEVGFPVAPGDQFTVRVLDTRGTLRLEVIRPGLPAGQGLPLEPLPAEAARALPAALLRDVQANASRLLSVLPATPVPGEPGDLLTAVARVAALLRPLEPVPGTGIPDRLRELCRNSGLFLETKLQNELTGDGTEIATEHPTNPASVRRILAADLKAQLSGLVHELETGAAVVGAERQSAEMIRSARALLSEIVKQQTEITRTTDESRQLTLVHFSLPLNTPGGAARLKVGFPRRRRGRSGAFCAALLVDLDQLGPVRVDLQLTERHLAADLFVQTPEHKPVLEDHLAELRANLAPLFEDVRVSVRVSEKKVADFEWEDLRPAVAGRLDVRA
jgi:hypothetical protein